MNTRIYDIDNSRIICRVLPFFVRGRRMILFLEAVASPLARLHKSFLKWAYRIIVGTRATSQTTVFIWYLNYLFREHFKDKNDSFTIGQDQDGDYMLAINPDEHQIAAMFFPYIYSIGEADRTFHKPVKYASDGMGLSPVVITAPKLAADSSYTETKYKSDIKEVADRYMTVFDGYRIIVKQ
jgi:hypothetical protein